MKISTVRIRVEADPHLAKGMSSSQIAKLERGILVSSCYRGVRVDNLSETMVFTSTWSLVSFLTSLSEAEAIRSEEFGSNATGKWHGDRAQFYKLAAGTIFKHRKRFFLEN